MSQDLARRKEDKLSGSHVNYYLQDIPNNVVVEAEDIIEFTDMSFSAGTVFKSIWRLCKYRMDLGKPGSTKIYESEKSVYYSDRTLTITQNRNRVGFFKALFGNIVHWRTRREFEDLDNLVISIRKPKRLEPYSFVLKDLIKALGATEDEAGVIKNIIAVSLVRKKSVLLYVPFEEEIVFAEEAWGFSERVNYIEKVLAS